MQINGIVALDVSLHDSLFTLRPTAQEAPALNCAVGSRITDSIQFDRIPDTIRQGRQGRRQASGSVIAKTTAQVRP
jgi:hypothetical protein